MQGFFLPYPRMWELLAGAILAAQALHKPQPVSPQTTRVADMRAAAGLSLILIGLLTINEDHGFPGWRALLPVVGAALLIQAGPQAWVNRRVLSHPLATGIGLISYPLYLWHWPLLAYLHITNAATAVNCAAAAGASVLLAWLTYQLIEKPIRPRRPTPLLIGTLTTLMLITGYLGLNTWQRDGLPFRFNKEPVSGSASAPSRIPHISWACPPPESPSQHLAECWADDRAPARVAIVGDSKAKALAHGLLEHSDTRLPWMSLGGTDARGSLVPVISTNPDRAGSQRQIQQALDTIQQSPTLEVVVITTATRALYQLAHEDRIDELEAAPLAIEQDAEEGLNRFITEVIRLGKQVILVIDNPTLKDPRRCMSRVFDTASLRITTQIDSHSNGCAVKLSQHGQSAWRYQSMMQRLQAQHPEHVFLFDLPIHLCDRPTGLCSHITAGQPMYSYSDHISNEASRRAAPALIDVVDALTKRASAATPSPANDQPTH